MLNPNMCIMSVDLEDWFQVENLRTACPINSWDSLEVRLNHGVDRLLELFGDRRIQATFYTVGYIAAKCPDIIRRIVTKGQELALHGYYHQLLGSMTSDEFRTDIRRCREVVENISGYKVNGFRAPACSITDWALDILSEEGFRYDSSYIASNLNSRFGKVSGQNSNNHKNIPWKIREALWELPMPSLNIAGRGIPWGGGGYFRLIPYPIFRKGIIHILNDRGYYHFFIHPWEFDDNQPRIRQIPWLNRFRHYVNLSETTNKMECILNDFEFVSTQEAIRRLESKIQ